MRLLLPLAAILLIAPPTARAEATGFCFSGSIGPAGCDAPQRRLEARDPGVFVLPGARDRIVRLPRFELPPPGEPLETRRGALAELDRTVPAQERRTRSLRRTRAGEILQPVPGEPLGRNPRAVQRYQTPYSFERRDSLGRSR